MWGSFKGVPLRVPLKGAFKCKGLQGLQGLQGFKSFGWGFRTSSHQFQVLEVQGLGI